MSRKSTRSRRSRRSKETNQNMITNIYIRVSFNIL